MRRTIFMLLAITFTAGKLTAQDSAALAMVRTWVEEKAFTFQATSMSPARGGMRQLTGSTYTVKVKGDTLICDLPYVGQAYNVNAAVPGETGMSFTSYKFTYESKAGKKDKWLLTIKTKDLKADRDMLFTFFDNGKATLNITSSDRQFISYQGVLTKK